MTIARTLHTNEGKSVVVTFDEYNTVDTITVDGRTISSTHPIARRVLAKADDIFAGIIPQGFRVPLRPKKF